MTINSNYHYFHQINFMKSLLLWLSLTLGLIIPMRSQYITGMQLFSECVNDTSVTTVVISVNPLLAQAGDTLVPQGLFFNTADYIPVDSVQSKYKFKFRTIPNLWISFSVTVVRNDQALGIFHLSQPYYTTCRTGAFPISDHSIRGVFKDGWTTLTWSGYLQGSHFEVFLDGELEGNTVFLDYSFIGRAKLIEIREIDYDGNILDRSFFEFKPLQQNDIIFEHNGMFSWCKTDRLQVNKLYYLQNNEGWRKIYVIQ